jgi:hypothetical protein
LWRPAARALSRCAQRRGPAITHLAIEFDIEPSLATRGQTFKLFSLGGQHRGTADKLALPFAQMSSAAKIAANVFVQVAEPPRRGAPAVRARQEFAAVRKLASTFALLNIYSLTNFAQLKPSPRRT